MGRFDNVLRKVNMVTGKTSRNLKSLDKISDWAASVQKFLDYYRIINDNPMGILLEKTGNAKFDLVGIIHNGRPVIDQARSLKGDIQDLTISILENVESIRRYMIEPQLQEQHLVRTLKELVANQELLLSAIDKFAAG